jgi:hypothetical protein
MHIRAIRRMEKDVNRVVVEDLFNHRLVGNIAPVDRDGWGVIKRFQKKLGVRLVGTDERHDLCAALEESAYQPASQKTGGTRHQDCFPGPEGEGVIHGVNLSESSSVM